MDVSVDLRVAPARQSATFLEEQSKALRANLEKAQATLSKFQQTKGIVVTDERLDQENARYSALIGAARRGAGGAGRDRHPAAQHRRRDLARRPAERRRCKASSRSLPAAQTKLSEVSSIVGKNHPTRQQLEAQVAELQRQLAAEIRRVSGGTSVSSRGSSQKVAELQTLVDEQKKQLLVAARRPGPDRRLPARRRGGAARLRRRRACGSRQLNMEGQNNQANTRLLSPAVEPLEPSRPKVLVGIVASLLGGLVAGLAAALAMEAARPPRPPARGPDRHRRACR